MSKDLIRGFLLSIPNTPKEVFNALDALNRPLAVAPETSKPKAKRHKAEIPENISEWDLPTKAIAALNRAQIYTLSQLLTLTETQLLKIHNFGSLSLKRVCAYIAPLKMPGEVDATAKLAHSRGSNGCVYTSMAPVADKFMQQLDLQDASRSKSSVALSAHA